MVDSHATPALVFPQAAPKGHDSHPESMLLQKWSFDVCESADKWGQSTLDFHSKALPEWRGEKHYEISVRGTAYALRSGDA
jgi:hypothetical protein